MIVSLVLTTTLSFAGVIATDPSSPQVVADPFAPKLHMKATKKLPNARPSRARTTLRRANANTGVGMRVVQDPRANLVDDCNSVSGILVCGLARTSVGDIAKDKKGKKAGEEQQPQLTLGDILEAVRTIGLPSLKANVEPGGATLVNFDTIYFANPQAFRRSVTLLGFNIAVAAQPVRYQWHHGDGTSQVSATAGRAYPHKDITHRYARTAKKLNVSVDVEYSVSYSVDGAPWSTIGQRLIATGPTTALEVKEATALLAK